MYTLNGCICCDGCVDCDARGGYVDCDYGGGCELYDPPADWVFRDGRDCLPCLCFTQITCTHSDDNIMSMCWT